MWMRTVVGWNVTLVLPPVTASKVLARLAELNPAVFQAVLESRVLCCCRRCAASQAGREGMEQGQGDTRGDKSVSEMLKIHGSDPGGGGRAEVGEEPQALKHKHKSGPQCQ